MSCFGVGIRLSFVSGRIFSKFCGVTEGLSLGNDFLVLDLVDFGDGEASVFLFFFTFLNSEFK